MDPPAPSPGPPAAPLSDVADLDADYEEVGRIMAASSRQTYAPTSDDADRLAVIADNFVSCMNLVQALGLLIDERNHEGSMIVFRALYEASINLVYLYDVGDRTRNALLARAYALQEIAETYAAAGARDVADEHRRLFEMMPKDLRRDLAQSGATGRRHRPAPMA